jgi:hypothetical protein
VPELGRAEESITDTCQWILSLNVRLEPEIYAKILLIYRIIDAEKKSRRTICPLFIVLHEEFLNLAMKGSRHVNGQSGLGMGE